MKLITFNICIKIGNSKEVGEFILSQDPDIVAFQEIIRHFDDSVFDMYKSKEDIEAITNKKLPYSFFGPLWISDAMRKKDKMHRDFNGFVEQGNEIMSKFPLITASNEFFHRNYEMKSEWSDFHTEDHPRAVQVVELKAEDKQLQILNLHGLYSRDKKDSERTLKQCKYILEAAKRKDIPTIIVGDFNLLPDTKSISIIEKEFRNLIKEYNIESTVPDFDHRTESKRGKFVMDYIFVNKKIKVNNFEVLETNISDHLPLMLDFDIII